jgi:succinate dehydrogenase/fumarate reductase cytochrome b subunit
LETNTPQSMNQPAYQAMPTHQPMAPVVTVKDWLITTLILLIPIVNIIMMFVWAFGDGTNPSKANYFKASLIWIAIVLGLYLIFGIAIAGIIASTFG